MPGMGGTPWAHGNHRLTCVLGHVVLELVDPLALVATVRAQILPFLPMDPHVVLWGGAKSRVCLENVHTWSLVELLPPQPCSLHQAGSPVQPLC